jgi:hypothetical protein
MENIVFIITDRSDGKTISMHVSSWNSSENRHFYHKCKELNPSVDSIMCSLIYWATEKERKTVGKEEIKNRMWNMCMPC